MADDGTLERLRSVPLFARLTDKQLKDVIGRGRIVDHPAGSLMEEGHGGVGFHLILEGSATVSQGGQVKATIGPGAYFGEISLLDGKPRSASITPDGPLRTLSLSSWQFLPLLDLYPQLSRELLLGLCEHVRRAEAAAADVPAPGRQAPASEAADATG